jgi:hypothetical protein
MPTASIWSKTIFILTVSAFLSGCGLTSKGVRGEKVWGRTESPMWFKTASPETQVAHFSEQCKAYGFKLGTDAFSNCVMNSIQNSKSAARQRMKEALDDLEKASKGPTNCHTSGQVYGSGTYSGTTTCY